MHDFSDLPLLSVVFVLSNQYLHSEHYFSEISVRKNGDLEQSTKWVGYHSYLSSIMSHQCDRHDLETLF